MKLKKRAATLMTTCAVLGGALAGVGATSASAAPRGLCNTIDVIRNTSDGYGHFKGSVAMHEHPYADCASKTYPSGQRFYFWCWSNNEYGNKWIFGRVAGTQDLGWVYSGNVTQDAGSLNKC
ncbi:hypothetical protein ACZ90_57590 [Streptomyces albus subsp. albus]|nr:hypothetical protein ACZ90_57590 [Streptomyces albus subsp. albus]